MPSDYEVTASWDAKAQVFVSQSDIPGLVIEAASFDEFVQLVYDLAPDMISDAMAGAKGPFTVHIRAERDVLLEVA